MRSLLQQVILTSVHANLRYRTALVLYLMILVLGSIPGARSDIGAVAPGVVLHCLLYTSPSPRDQRGSRMPSSA